VSSSSQSSSKSKQAHAAPPASDAPASDAPGADDDDSVFFAPEDLVGDDFAAQLQGVLDEARSQLEATAGDDAAIDEAQTSPQVEGSLASTVLDDEPNDDAVFESPDEVCAISETDAAGADDEPVAEDIQALDAQLKQLLDMTASDSDAESSSPGGAQALDESDSEDSLDDAFVDARDLFEEAAQLAAVADEVTASSTSSATSSAASIEIQEPRLAQSTMKQLDAFLADQADHAVADAFDTVQDVVSEEMDGEALAHSSSTSAASNDASAYDDEFDSPDQLLMSDGQPFDGGDVAKTEAAAAHAAHAGGAAAVSSLTRTELAAELASDSSHAELADARTAKVSLRVKLGHLLARTGVTTYQLCAALNRPLRHASASKRRMVGMIGLITLGNASVLLLGKLLHFWG